VTRTQAAAQFHAAEARRPPGVDRNVSIPRNWRLENGQSPQERILKIRLYGPESAPLVAVAGRVCSGRFMWTGDDGGWWASLVGPDRAVDHSAWRVLAFDFAPPSNQRIEITPADQARLLALVLDDLGEPRLHAFIGASYGGMIGLAFAERFPERITRLCVLCAAHRPSWPSGWPL
jgi:homoserine O-acetyltransferase